jgi:nucleotide-binding universal stress UspA family protein
MFGPIIVVGPEVTEFESFSGDIVVPVDGSEFSETSLPLAAAWGIALGATPWVVEVLTEATPTDADVLESSYPSRLARNLQAQSHHDVEFDVLHGANAGDAIADYATRNKVRLIVMSTHGRTGLRRLTLGSTAASVVHRATCPVVLHRPPRLAMD